MSGWGEVTIRTPGAFAGPEDMHRVISELFCHDSVLRYQQRSTEAGLREAVIQLREAFAKVVERRGGVPKDVTMHVDGLLNELDPDHENWGGYFPSQMVCPFHEQPDRPGWNPVAPVFSKCPGVPWCRAHEGVRVE